MSSLDRLFRNSVCAAFLAIFATLLVAACDPTDEARQADVLLTEGSLTAVTQLNSGGGSVSPFAADQLYSGGGTYSAGNSVAVSGVVGAGPAPIYQSERYGTFSYRLAGYSPNAPYTVRLHFAEIYWNAAGSRLFHVAINGSRVLSDFDVFAAAGGANRAVVRDFVVNTNASGQLNIDYITVRDNAKSSGIEVLVPDSANQAPSIATAAAANPAVVTNASTSLSVLGADDGGAANLSYTWSAVGTPPGPVSFSANGTNAARVVTATFTASGTYVLRATVRDQAGLSATSDTTVNVQIASAPAGSVLFRVNSGGGAVSPFEADRNFIGGSVYSTGNAITTNGVSNAAPAAVYQSERYGNHSYTFTGLTAGQSHTVRLHFAEIYFSSAGSRVFNVAINGIAVLTNFDIFAAAGANKALVRDFSTTANATGQITVQYVTVVDNAKSSGIEIISAAPSTGGGTAPSVARAAAATPSSVSATSTALSVLGSDDGGETNLTYAWATSGAPPAAVTFSPNGTNAAKNSTAMFAAAGSYSLVVTIRDQAGQTTTSTTTVSVTQTVGSLSVTPESAVVAPSTTRQFSVVARDQFAVAMTTPAVTWSVSGGGSISSGGLFTAGTSIGGPFTVTVSGSGRSGTGTVTVSSATPGVPNPSPTEVVVGWTDTKQTMVGFGASDSNEGNDGEQFFTDATADLLFSTTKGIGLSLIRLQMGTRQDVESVEHLNTIKAVARGAKPWVSPWSAPGAWKTTGTVNSGGHLLPAYYDAWATRLAGIQAVLQSHGAGNLYAVSTQNEPDWPPADNGFNAYPAMRWTNAEMVAFIKVLGPKLAALSPRPKLVVGEFSNWDNIDGLISALNGDSLAASYVDVTAVHQYFGTPRRNSGRWPTWQTEVSNLGGPWDATIADGMSWAVKIHAALVDGDIAAWHYWTLANLASQDDNASLLRNNDETPKRFWVLGQWSRFVRPGYVRVGSEGGPSSVYVSSFRDPATGRFAIVVANESGASRAFGISLRGSNPSSVTPWRTSSTENLQALPTVAPSNGRLSVTVPNHTVTTFVGTGN